MNPPGIIFSTVPVRRREAYTLIEVLAAAAILMIAVAAAAALALATIAQEETNTRIARCINLHEQAVRLYQLGLGADQITAILPVDPAVVSLVFTPDTPDLAIPGLGTVEKGDWTMQFESAPSAPSTQTPVRTSVITAVRPRYR